MTVSAVVLSYNRPHLLREALASVAAQTHPPDEVLVVDNHSPASDEVARVVAEFPSVRLIANRENLGFAGGMNAGLRAAAGEYVLLTEDDLVLDPGCVRAFAACEAGPGRGALLGGVLVNRSARTVLAAGGRFALGGVCQQKLLREGEPADALPADPYPADFVSGALMFAARPVWDRVGGFREDFFVYCEDVELGLRARRRGVSVLVVPGARADHHEAPARPPPPVVQYHKFKNFFATYLLHAEARVLPEFLVRYAGLPLLRLAATGDRQVVPLGRGLAWCLRHLPTLLRDRRHLARPDADRCES